MLPGRLILVRHGETVWNGEGKYLGQSNPGLNQKGKIQAREAARLLSGEEIDMVFSSDLLRAVETAREIAGVHNVPVRMIPSLREIDFGAWEGLTFAEIQTCYPELLTEWLRDPFRVRIPDGETAEEVRYRVIDAWNSVTLSASGEKTVVIVAHGGPLRMLACHLTGADLSRQWDFNLGHGETMVLQRNGSTYSIMHQAEDI
ncbi:MAG TPA: alpha-ribazole phosphatase [Syntrophomonadaceae bacterium]|nr:alpha-ribazole phosphatase [Syntrophomonadaceae bacterium]